METFDSVIRKYIIQIPIIQRDYAQGRNNIKSSEVRSDFLDSIENVLRENRPLHLDFIYGDFKDDRFLPLDGQQRLTTLFLLHWYFGQKGHHSVSHLRRFTYETRASSREFCMKLVDSEISFSAKQLSESIIDSPWFYAAWSYDPTIKSMLVMLDAIHARFHNDSFYERLQNLSFDFFTLENFGLDDDLYVKMNARGKSLTNFEIFKAQFEQHLQSVDKTLGKQFERKIDNQWTDLMWHFAVADQSYVVDKFLMNVIQYVAEMLHYSSSGLTLETSLSNRNLLELFKSKESINFLFKILDNIEEIQSTVDEVFASDSGGMRVKLFDEGSNLFDKVITGKALNIQQRILLFLVIHGRLFDINILKLKDVVKAARNLTYSVKHLKKGEITYTADLGFSNISPILKIFLPILTKDSHDLVVELENAKLTDTGITKRSLEHELDKLNCIKANPETRVPIHEMEDHEYLKGDLSNFFWTDDVKLLQYACHAMKKIWLMPDEMIIQMLLTVDDYSLQIGWTFVGDKYFFGKENYWEIILTANSNSKIDYKIFFTNVLNSYMAANGDVASMLNKYLDHAERDWRYYFVKYPSIVRQIRVLSKDNNLFAAHWNDCNFEIEKLGGSNLNAYHLNPYLFTIAEILDNLEFAKSVQGKEQSYLQTEYFRAFIYEDGWHLFELNLENHSDLLRRFSLQRIDDYYLLQDNLSDDRIETLTSFFICLNPKL
jgi:uncharacterized protein with ParB-like and HNH nuclease domain